MLLRYVLILFLMLNFTSVAHASRDGKVGGISMGSSAISVTIPKVFRAQLAPQIDFQQSSGQTDINISTNYGTAARSYQLLASGDGSDGAFTLRGTNGHKLTYQVAYRNQSQRTQKMQANRILTAQSGTQKLNDKPMPMAKLAIQIPENDLKSSANQEFNGTLTLVFLPN